MSDAKTVLTTEQIAELRRLERAWHDAPDHTLERTGAKAEYEMCIRNAAPALLDAAERCGELERDVAGFSKAVDAANAVGRVHYDMLTTATRERDEMARELERAREAMKKLHPRPSHGLLGDIGCVADRVGSNSDAWEELLRERDAAIARAEAAEKERESLMARIEEVSGVTAAECPLSVEAALAALDKLDRMRPVVEALVTWGKTRYRSLAAMSPVLDELAVYVARAALAGKGGE